MKELDKVINFINNKKHLIENIFYKYCILKKYSDNFHKDLTNKFLNKINSKNNEIGDYALKLKKKLILEKEEERILDLIIKYFKYDYLKKKMELKRKIIKKNKNSEPSISLSNSDNLDSSDIEIEKSLSTESCSISSEINNNFNNSSSSVKSISSFYSSENTSSSYCNDVIINKSNNKNIFLTRDNLINDFGKKIKHHKKKSPKKTSSKKKEQKLKKGKKNNKNIEKIKDLSDNMDKNNLNQNSNNNLNNDEIFGIKIKNKGIIRI